MKQFETGIIIGTDLSQEWLLSWWWDHYQKHNDFPVAFIDFGMTFEAKKWCQKHGELISLRAVTDFVKNKEEIQEHLNKDWVENWGTYCWEAREAWFQKPLACLITPFKKTLWIDIDCEIRVNLSPLFDLADEGLAMAKDQHPQAKNIDYLTYNSGVIAFKKGHSAIQKWAKWCMEKNHLYRGDQEVFSKLIDEEKLKVTEIPPLYNYSRMREETEKAKVLHWHGPPGKQALRIKLQLEEIQSLF